MTGIYTITDTDRESRDFIKICRIINKRIPYFFWGAIWDFEEWSNYWGE